MVAVDKGTDIFGVLLMAVFTALGGGTLRDMLIGYFPPRMFTNFHYVLLACLCAIIVFAIARTFKERYVARERMIEQINNVFDAIGLGVFAVSGARIGMEAGFADNMFLTTFLGTTTAIGGGMIRDVLLREMPFVLQKARLCRRGDSRRAGLCAAAARRSGRSRGLWAGHVDHHGGAHAGNGV